MLLSEMAIICADSTRTKAYLQHLCKNALYLNKCYIMTTNKELLEIEEKSYVCEDSECKYFDIKQPLIYTLNKYNIPYEYIDTQNINDDLVMRVLLESTEKYIIYSGFGGQIIKKELFGIGKRFIHIHAGVLPSYRGSTTAYYSIINRKTCGATAIFMSAGIDEGNVILTKEFPMPDSAIEIDYIYEPHIRALVLLEAIQNYLNTKSFSCEEQSSENNETYFIIHPALKHLAMLLVDQKAAENKK